MAFAEMDRKPMAGELLDLLAQSQPRRRPLASHGRPKHAAVEPIAGRVARPVGVGSRSRLRRSRRRPRSRSIGCLAHRVGYRWSPDKATGPATLALCRWSAETRFDGERYTLKVFVNDVLAKTLDVDPTAGTQTIDVPAAMLKKEGKQRINFQIAGRGRYSYQCVLGGFVPADKLKATTDDWTVERTYEPAPLEVDGREIPRGFDVVQAATTSSRIR